MESARAAFVSHAAEDSAAARRICDALRAGGVEVWFDQAELRGGDAWDQKIRKQIRTCALFIPVISRNTHARTEGYFRLEWKLAVDRSHLMTANRAFLLPVVVDDTREDDEEVPDRFREVQWVRLPGGDTPPEFIERVRRLLAPDEVSAPQRLDSSQSRTARAGAAAAAPQVHRSRSWLPAAGALGAVALLGLGYLAFVHRSPQQPSAGVAATGSAASAALAESIAVLPFANESGDPAQQYFSDGLSEDLITALAKFPGVKVIGRTSSFRFRDSKEDSRTIGAKLGVTHLLEGSVRRAADIVRVSAELVNTADGSTLWSERYDRAYKDLFVLQDDITRSVAGALKTKLLPAGGARAQSDRPPGGSLEAYNALLQGKFYAERNTEADMRRALAQFTRATELDPGYAVAWSWLSRVWSGLAVEFLEDSAGEVAYTRARKAADTALALAPDLAVAHVAHAFILQTADFDWHGAEAEFQRALALAPDDDEARFRLGHQLAIFGELDRAVALTQQSLASDPLRARWHHWLGLYNLSLDRLDEAQAAVERAIELQPTAAGYHDTLAMIEIRRGNAAAALAAAQREPPGVWQDISLALARQIGGDRPAAEAALKNLIDKHTSGSPYQIAEAYALRKDADQVFAWLERAWATRDPGISGLLIDPFLRPYRGDPRFAAICRKVGLPAPAERHST